MPRSSLYGSKRRGGGGGITYLLRVGFNTDDSSPLTSPYVGEVGSLTAVQTDGTFAASSGKLAFTAQATHAWGDQYLVFGTSRATSRLVSCEFEFSGRGLFQFGFLPSLAGGVTGDLFTAYSSAIRIASASDFVVYNNFTLSDVIRLTVIQRSNGAFFVGRVGSGSDKLLYVTNTTAAATPYAGFQNSIVSAGSLDNMIVADTFVTDSNFQFAKVAAPSTGEIISATSDAIIEITWTPASSETLEVMFRRTDDNNTWILRCAQAGGTIKLYEKVAGGETERDSGKTQTWTIGTPYRVQIIADTTNIESVVNDVGKHNYASAVFNSTVDGVKVSGFATASNLIAWRRSVTLPL